LARWYGCQAIRLAPFCAAKPSGKIRSDFIKFIAGEKTRRPGVSRKTALALGFKINSPDNQLLASGRFEEVVMSTKPEQQRPMPTRKNGRKSKPISRCDDEEEVREEIKTS